MCVGKTLSVQQFVDSTGHLGKCWEPWQGGRWGHCAFVGLGIRRFVSILNIFLLSFAVTTESQENSWGSPPGTSAKSVYVINSKERANPNTCQEKVVQSFLHLGRADKSCAWTNPEKSKIRLVPSCTVQNWDCCGVCSPSSHTQECCVLCFSCANKEFSASVSTAAGRRLPQNLPEELIIMTVP